MVRGARSIWGGHATIDMILHEKSSMSTAAEGHRPCEFISLSFPAEKVYAAPREFRLFPFSSVVTNQALGLTKGINNIMYELGDLPACDQ